MGNSQLATVIEYWDSVHAEIARAKINDIHEDLQALPIFGLRYNPCSLLCSVCPCRIAATTTPLTDYPIPYLPGNLESTAKERG